MSIFSRQYKGKKTFLNVKVICASFLSESTDTITSFLFLLFLGVVNIKCLISDNQTKPILSQQRLLYGNGGTEFSKKDAAELLQRPFEHFPYLQMFKFLGGKWNGLVGFRLHAVFFNAVQQKKSPSESCLLYTSPSPRDQRGSRMPSSA